VDSLVPLLYRSGMFIIPVIFTALIAQIVVVWVVMPCSLVRGYLHWGGTGCLQFSPKCESSCTRLHGSITLKTVIWVGLTNADLNKAVLFRAINMAFNNSKYILSEPLHIHWYGFGYCIFKTVSSARFYHSVFILAIFFFIMLCAIDCLWAGWSGDQIPVGARFSAPV
jgi:hypothetical protein